VVRHRASRLDAPALGRAPGPLVAIAPLAQAGATGVAVTVAY
jgi:hypothetical protein